MFCPNLTGQIASLADVAPVHVHLDMISDQTVDRFYYIFDSRERRPLVVDRWTGKEVDWARAPRVQLIEHVADTQSEAVVRRFARWCARQTGVDAAPSDSPAGRLWAAARAPERSDWSAVRADTTDVVVEAVALGLPQGDAEAARLLTTHACTHSKARQAAIDAAHMSERWVEFEADGTPGAAVRTLRQRHVDWLLDVLGSAQKSGIESASGSQGIDE